MTRSQDNEQEEWKLSSDGQKWGNQELKGTKEPREKQKERMGCVSIHLDGFWFEGPSGFDVSFQVDVQELKYEIQLLVGVHDV